MGRNIKPDQQQIVPINGAVYRNSSSNYLIIDAYGAQYFPSNGSGLLSASDYSKYVSLNSSTVSAYGISVSPNAVSNAGTVNYYATWSPSSLGPYAPYSGSSYQYGYYPFAGQRGKYRFTGQTAASGSYTVMMYQPMGYMYGSSYPSYGNDAYVYNSSGVPISLVTSGAMACWYDAGTSTYRVVGGNNFSTGSTNNAVLYTSSNGTSWTSTTCSATPGGSGNYFSPYYMGSQSYFQTASVANGQKVFIVLRSEAASGTQYCLWCSTDGGASFTDRTSALAGAGTYYFSGFSGYNSAYSFGSNINYDGTTLFVPRGSSWKYSTNSGSSFSNTTVSGTVSSYNNSLTGGTVGANSSTFMYVVNSSVSSNVIYVTTDGGQSFTTYSWTPASTLTTNYYNPMDYDPTNSRWCFLYWTANGVYAATSTNNGSTWSHNLLPGSNANQSESYLAYLDDAFYAMASGKIYRSTDGTTWTYITTYTYSGYGQPYFSLTNYVVLGNKIIKKSDQSVTNYYPSSIFYSGSNYKTFGNYVSSDMWVSQQVNYGNYVQVMTSATAGTANYYSPYPYYGQQSLANYPTNIEYWRIK
jgi:hypothetical protein